MEAKEIEKLDLTPTGQSYFDNQRAEHQRIIKNGRKLMDAKEIEKMWRIEPYYDGISTVVTTYKVVDQNGTLQYMGDRNQCEYFLQHGS